jgi:hypothetical protein
MESSRTVLHPRETTMAATKTKPQGKTSFVKEVLFDNPKANTKIVQEAWKAAGMEGTISESLIKSMRSELGLAGNLRPGTKPSVGKPATRASKAAKPTRTRTRKTAAKAPAAKVQSSPASEKKPLSRDRDRVLADIEGDIDRLIFKLMVAGDLVKIEDELRRVRRQLIRSFKA